MDLLLPVAAAAIIAGGTLMRLSYMEDDGSEGAIPISFGQFKRIAKSGDLIFTSSIHITSTITRSFMGSQWSHCGMVYVGNDSTIYEWSSHRLGEGLRAYDGRVHDGPQLIPISNLASTIYFCPVKCDHTKVANLIYKLSRAEDMPFVDILGLMGCAFFMPSIDTGMGVTCAQMVALTYMACGLLVIDRPLTNYIPQSFSPIGGDAVWRCKVSPKLYVVFVDGRARKINLRRPFSLLRLKNK